MSKLTLYNVGEYDSLPVKNENGGYFYVLEYGNHVKIGSTRNPLQRIKNLSKNAHAYGSVLTGQVAISPPHKNYFVHEKRLHSMFSEFRKPGTELFDISINDVCKYVESTNSIAYVAEHSPDGYKPNPLYIEKKTKKVQLFMRPSVFKQIKERAKGERCNVNDFIHRILENATGLHDDNFSLGTEQKANSKDPITPTMAALVNKLATLNDKDSQYLLGIGVGLAMAKRTEENKDNN
jgi:hypothetical protein